MRLVSYRGPQPLLAAARWCVDCRRKPLEDETVHGGSPYPKRIMDVKDFHGVLTP